MRSLLALALLLALSAPSRRTTAAPTVERHVRVYSERGRFGGWPANHGIWSWEDEILVGYGRGYFKDLGLERHAIDRERPEEHWLARSHDGGETWSHEHPGDQGFLVPAGEALHGVAPPYLKQVKPRACPGGIDFTSPGLAFTARMTDIHTGPSRFHYSLDRGKTWYGPFHLPNMGTHGVAARTDYIVGGRDHCMLFLTAAKANKKEGRTFCAETTDGGKSWQFVSFIGSEPEGFSIMPSTVRISPKTLVSAVRRREGPSRFIDAYISRDNGRSWEYLNRPVESAGEGNPPSLIRLADGRLCLTYGYRAEPFGIRAKLSSDHGQTWGPAFHLRDDGGGRDVGYPRSVQRPDGKVVTVYYFHDDLKGDRYIAATIWDPGEGTPSLPVFSRKKDIIYGHKYGTALTLDVLAPDTANGLGVIWVVSGGWFSDHRAIGAPLVADLLRRGYTIFAVVHGSQPKYTIPEILDDMHRAVRFVRHHAEDYSIDPGRVGIFGGSAGGHLSLMQGAASQAERPNEKDPVDRESSRVQAVACFFPPTDFLNYGKKGEVALGNGVLKNFRAPFQFRRYDKATTSVVEITDEKRRLEIGREISPLYHISEDDAPTLVVHGDADQLVPIEQAERFVANLKEVGIPTELVVKSGAGHGWKGLENDMSLFADWFDKHLREAKR